MRRPRDDEYPGSCRDYVGLVPEDDILTVLARQPEELRALASRVPRDRESFRYAAGKWSIREVIGHMTDGERVFGYRAFCISRGDQVSLPGFDENEYVAASGYDRRPLGELVGVFSALRAANLAEFRAMARRTCGTGWAPPTTRRSPCARWPIFWPATFGTTWASSQTATRCHKRRPPAESHGPSPRRVARATIRRQGVRA